MVEDVGEILIGSGRRQKLRIGVEERVEGGEDFSGGTLLGAVPFAEVAVGLDEVVILIGIHEPFFPGFAPVRFAAG